MHNVYEKSAHRMCTEKSSIWLHFSKVIAFLTKNKPEKYSRRCGMGNIKFINFGTSAPMDVFSTRNKCGKHWCGEESIYTRWNGILFDIAAVNQKPMIYLRHKTKPHFGNDAEPQNSLLFFDVLTKFGCQSATYAIYAIGYAARHFTVT